MALHLIRDSYDFLKRRFCLISWISLVIYLFYNSFIYYRDGRQFFYLRRILGIGLCVSRSTATVLNLCCALVLLPLCKKLNQVLYWALARLWPGLFFIWLENAKSFHMTVAITLLIFGVIHSIAHFVNLWSFSREYDDVYREINLADYKNQNPFLLLLSYAGVTGTSMLAITLAMGVMSSRVVRRKFYNAFWYTHQLYLPFVLLLIIHPLSGVLKEEILEEPISDFSEDGNWVNSSSVNVRKFEAIKSRTWLWVGLPLACFMVDLVWRVFSRNAARVDILQTTHMVGRMVSLTLRVPHEGFECRRGQYVLLQCTDISLLEWHPFTVVTLPTSTQRSIVIWIRVKGDWTEALEKLLIDKAANQLCVLVDGPLSSPMERVACSEVAICVAAGVGITPFVSTLHHILDSPRSRLPGRVHLIWIVRNEREVTWLAGLAEKCILQLRNANRPDRLHLQIYVTGPSQNMLVKEVKHAFVNEKGVTYVNGDISEEKQALLTPCVKRKEQIANGENIADMFSIAKEYPILACRIRRGRPYWDRVFGYWVHLYQGELLHLYCCGPKKLVRLLRSKCKQTSKTTKTKFEFVHEGFS